MSGGVAWAQAYLFSVHGVLTEFNVQHRDSSHWETKARGQKVQSSTTMTASSTPKTSQGYMALGPQNKETKHLKVALGIKYT